MTQPIHPLIPDSTMMRIPSDVFAQILIHLSARGIHACNLVCKEWNEMLKSDRVWHALFDHHFSTIHPSSIHNFKNVQDAYKMIHLNLTKGIGAVRTLQGRNFHIYSLAIADGKLISCPLNHDKIHLWDIHTLECITTFHKGRENDAALSRFAFIDGKFFSGSIDGAIKVWEADTGRCLAHFQGLREDVTTFAFAEGKLFAGFSSGTIQTWDIHTGVCTMTWPQHSWKGKVESLAFADGKLFSRLFCELQVWDIDTGKCIGILQESGKLATCSILAEGKLFSAFEWCDHYSIIKIWDINTLNCFSVLQTNRELSIASLAFADGKLFLGFANGTIELWDININKRLAVFHEYKDIYSLAFAHGKLFSSLIDGTIKVLDFTANHNTIFQEIADEIETIDQIERPQATLGQLTRLVLDRFSRMPTTAKDLIYRNIYNICKPIENSHWEDASFYWDNCATPSQQAQAIKDYLKMVIT